MNADSEEEKDKIIKDMASLLKSLANKSFKYKNLSWDEIEREFYNTKDLREKLIMIKSIITQKSVCKDNKCPVFPELFLLTELFTTIDATNKKDALKLYDIKSLEFEVWQDNYNQHLMELAKLFSDVYQLYVVTNTKRFEKKENLNSLIKVLDKFNESNMPVPMQFQQTAQKMLNDQSAELYFDDDDIIKKQKQIAFQKEMKTKKRKTTAEKIRDQFLKMEEEEGG